MSHTVLIVAAERQEFSGIERRMHLKPLSWGLQFASEADFNGMRVVFVAHGAGMQLAGAAADTARRYIRPDAVVSTGFCGGIDPSLQAGDVFLASRVIDVENRLCYDTDRPECGREVASGDLLSLSRVATTAEEKRGLRSTGARAVEMEAAAVAARARLWGVPFYCVRSVSDTAEESFAVDFNRMRDGMGRFSRSRIVLNALSRPWERVPSLLRLNRKCRMAAKSLGDFIANCRF